jgi:membrane-associated phospholipid phosphatase
MQGAALIIAILFLICATAWVFAAVIPNRVAPPLGRFLTALNKRIERGDTWLARIIPSRWGTKLSEFPLIAGLALLIISGLWGFFGILEDVVMGDPIVGVDKVVFDRLHELRTGPIDRLMTTVTGLGDQAVVIPVVVIVLAALALYRRWRAAVYLIFAVAGAAVFVAGVKLVIHRPRPVSIYDGVAEYSFPSGHACMSVVVFGFLAVLVAYGATRTQQRTVAVVSLMLILLIAFSRVYLGAHWLSDVLAGMAFGIAWNATLALFYVRTNPKPLPTVGLSVIAAAALLAAGTLHTVRDGSAELGRYGKPLNVNPPPPAMKKQ